MDNNIISALDEQFKKDCKVISLKYEYPGYTGIEQWAIVTDLTEAELDKRYAELIAPLRPFVVLSASFGEVRRTFKKNEDKYQKRMCRSIEPFDYDDELLMAHHPELICNTLESEAIIHQESLDLQNAIASLNNVQKKRLIMFFFEDKTYREIAAEENVSVSTIFKSISAAIENLKKILT